MLRKKPFPCARLLSWKFLESQSTPRSKVLQGDLAPSDLRGKHDSHAEVPDEQLLHCLTHLQLFPTHKSHYKIKSTDFLLHPGLSITKMYNMFVSWMHQQHKDKPVPSVDTYRKCFHGLGLKMQKPAVDACTQRDAFKLLTDATDAQREAHNRHLLAANVAYAAKSADQRLASSSCGRHQVLCFDMQRLLPCPRLGNEQMYYLRQLWLVTEEATLFMWNESEGRKGSLEIASCLWQSPTGTGFRRHLVFRQVWGERKFCAHLRLGRGRFAR